MDETQLQIGTQAMRVLVFRHWRSAKVPQSVGDKEHVTYVATIAADGRTLRPIVIFPTQTVREDLAVFMRTFIFETAEKGWMTLRGFLTWACEVC